LSRLIERSSLQPERQQVAAVHNFVDANASDELLVVGGYVASVDVD
jgi:hypothetical protein